MLTGEADGRLGSATRAAVKQAQLKVGLPADAYPTQELIERLRGGAVGRFRAGGTRRTAHARELRD